VEGPMSGSGNGNCRSYAAFSALGNDVKQVGNRVNCGFMHPSDDMHQTAARNGVIRTDLVVRSLSSAVHRRGFIGLHHPRAVPDQSSILNIMRAR